LRFVGRGRRTNLDPRLHDCTSVWHAGKKGKYGILSPKLSEGERGVITRALFRLHPNPKSGRRVHHRRKRRRKGRGDSGSKPSQKGGERRRNASPTSDGTGLKRRETSSRGAICEIGRGLQEKKRGPPLSVFGVGEKKKEIEEKSALAGRFGAPIELRKRRDSNCAVNRYLYQHNKRYRLASAVGRELCCPHTPPIVAQLRQDEEGERGDVVLGLLKLQVLKKKKKVESSEKGGGKKGKLRRLEP